MVTQYSQLGLSPARSKLGRVEEGRWFRPPTIVETFCTFDGWTIDNVSLISMFRDDVLQDESDFGFVTMINNSDASVELLVESLRALLLEDEREDIETRMPDGRVILMYCNFCFDPSCGGLSAEIVMDEQSVTWRDIAWQTDWDVYVPDPIRMNWINAKFERKEYEEFVRGLIANAQAKRGAKKIS